MTDLVTRLRALADLYGTTSATVMPHGKIGRALREAADALENDYNCAQEVIAELTEDRDDLKAKLAEAKELGSARQRIRLCERAEKAEAEAAALREALTPLAMDDETAMSFMGPYFAITIREALSQPGPGAAYQERVKKLERVLGIANQLGCRITAEGGHGLPVHALVLDLAEALAALEEKP